MEIMIKDISEYLYGQKLYGDDFSYKQIEKWYEDEKEAYANLYSNEVKGNYPYHSINNYNAFRFLDKLKYEKVMSIGGAFGDELLPIIDKIENIIILEPSEQMKVEFIKNKPVKYVAPNISGEIPFPDNFFDLITCSGVLHHIPNVSFVVSEIARVLKKGGVFILREPIVSMGDWRKPRQGLTTHERGIPLNILRNIIKNNKLEIVRETPCFSKPFDAIFSKLTGKDGYSTSIYPPIDAFLGKLLLWNYRYHATSILHKFRPSAVFYVLEKTTL